MLSGFALDITGAYNPRKASLVSRKFPWQGHNLTCWGTDDVVPLLNRHCEHAVPSALRTARNPQFLPHEFVDVR